LCAFGQFVASKFKSWSVSRAFSVESSLNGRRKEFTAPVGDAAVEQLGAGAGGGGFNVLTGQGFGVTFVHIGTLRRRPRLSVLVILSTGEIMAFTIGPAEFSASTWAVAF